MAGNITHCGKIIEERVVFAMPMAGRGADRRPLESAPKWHPAPHSFELAASCPRPRLHRSPSMSPSPEAQSSVLRPGRLAVRDDHELHLAAVVWLRPLRGHGRESILQLLLDGAMAMEVDGVGGCGIGGQM